MIPELGAQVRPHNLPTSTWDEIVQLAERFDAARVMAKRQNGDSLSKNKKPFQKKPSYAQVLTTPSTSPRPGNSRQPSTSKPPFKHHPKLTPELRKQLMAEGKCLFCREKGHILPNCPKRPQNSKPANVTSKPEVTSAAITVKRRSTYKQPPPAPSPPTHSDSSRTQSDPDHSTLSWTGCYDDDCYWHRSDKEGSGWYPKKPRQHKHQVDDDRNPMHPHVGWRNCIDDYCITHLDKKELELWDYAKPVNFEQVWKQRLREEQRYTKPSPPTPKPKVHEHTFHPKHTFRPCPKFSLPPKTNTLRATIVPDLTSHTAEKPLGVIIKTNNYPARALIDTATTGTNLISNNFCYQHGIKSWSLPEPLPISLALKGSRTILQREALAMLQLGSHEIPCKFRLTNLDKWDMILGMPILGKFKATTFDPITEFPDIFPEKVPNELPPLREPHMRHRIKLIDPEKIINPQVIPIAEKYYSQFREHITKNLDSGQIYPSSSQASAIF